MQGYIQRQSSGGVQEKDVLGNFATFTEKHLRQFLFFNKVSGLFLRILFIIEQLWAASLYYRILKLKYIFIWLNLNVGIYTRIYTRGNVQSLIMLFFSRPVKTCLKIVWTQQ